MKKVVAGLLGFGFGLAVSVTLVSQRAEAMPPECNPRVGQCCIECGQLCACGCAASCGQTTCCVGSCC